MKYLIIIILFTIVLVLIACSRNSKLQTIPSNAFLVDVRTPKEFKAGHVPNSINIPLSEIENSISQFTDKENIIVFCRSGNRSGKALKKLNANGIENVTNGGSWKAVLSVVDSNK